MNKYLSLLVIIFIFSACDFKIPDKWEAPNWHLPITIPLIDKTYYISDISSGQNEIQIDSLSQTFIISIDTTLLDSGEIVIEESYFQVPSLASIATYPSGAVTLKPSGVLRNVPIPCILFN